MTRTFGDYARSFVENLDARRAYRWASGLCVGLALVTAIDTVSTESTQPQIPSHIILYNDAMREKYKARDYELKSGDTGVRVKITDFDDGERLMVLSLSHLVDGKAIVVYDTDFNGHPDWGVGNEKEYKMLLDLALEARKCDESYCKIADEVRHDVTYRGKIKTTTSVNMFPNIPWIPWLSLLKKDVAQSYEKRYTPSEGFDLVLEGFPNSISFDRNPEGKVSGVTVTSFTDNTKLAFEISYTDSDGVDSKKSFEDIECDGRLSLEEGNGTASHRSTTNLRRILDWIKNKEDL